MILTRRGAEVPRNDPVAAARVRRELTVAPISLNDPFPKKFNVYRETPTHFIVPVTWALTALPHLAVTDRRGTGLGTSAPLAFAGKLKAELRQPEAVEAVLRQWGLDAHGARLGGGVGGPRPAGGGAMLCLPPGYGKTAGALYLASVLKKRTLVVVHKSFLKDQWVERVTQFLPGARVTGVQGDTCDTSGDVVIAMLQTLVARKYPPSTFRDIGLVIVDEAHHVSAPGFSSAMFGLAAPYTLALSATPDRKDGLGRVVTWFLGDIAYRLRRENQAGTEVRTVRYSCDRYAEPPPVNRRGDVCFTSVVTALTLDDTRTDLVARQTVALAGEGRDVLVLSHRREHCKAVAERVAAAGVACATYLGGDKEAPDTQVIVATFALTSEGFDMPRLTALVLATPASDVEQSCGRVMRGTHTGTGAVIVDIVDQWGVCFAQHAKRRALYRRSGFEVVTTAGGPSEEDPGDVQAVPRSFAFVDG